MSWDTPPLECTVNGVMIVVESIDDEHGRAVVEHLYPGRNEPDLEDVGGAPHRVRITGLVWDPTATTPGSSQWLLQLELLKAAVTGNSADELVHPQFGTLTGKVTRLTITHRDAEHNMARIALEFTEGSVVTSAFTVSTTTASAAAGVRSAGDEATAALAAWS